MINYLKMYLLSSGLFLIYLTNYIVLRETEQGLYLGRFFEYDFDIENLAFAYIISVPFIASILQLSLKKIFPMLLSTLMILGVLPGIIIYALSNNSSMTTFFIFYIYVIFILSLFTRKEIELNIQDPQHSLAHSKKINLKVLQVFGFIGFIFYIYLTVKYVSILQFRSINDVYIQRSLFASVVSGWEVYFITFAKYISAFSFLIIAINLRKISYLLPTIYIYLIDYALAAHKASIVLLLFSIFYYTVLSKVNIKRYYFIALFIVIFIFSLLLQLSIYFSASWSVNLVGLYDRVFHVTSGLFARFYEFANENYFFYGGSGILGKIFSGVNEAYTFIIGEAYFSENVRANADIIADGYINFGIIGSFLQLFILWLFFNRTDDHTFETNFNSLIPLILIYSMVLFSMGLQTALLTGGMFFFVLLIKFGFKE